MMFTMVNLININIPIILNTNSIITVSHIVTIKINLMNFIDHNHHINYNAL